MTAGKIALLVGACIPMLGGLFAIRVGVRRNMGLLKGGGLVLFILGVFAIYRGFFKDPLLSWTRHSTEDGVLSAEFPGTPTRDIKSAGGVESHRAFVNLEESDLYFLLSYSEGEALLVKEDFYASVRAHFSGQKTPSGESYEFVREDPIQSGGYEGRSFEFGVGSHRMYVRVFMVGTRIYRAIAVGAPDRPELEKFLSSVQVSGGGRK